MNLKLDNLGQLIVKYPQLKKCSVDMLECLDFTRIDNNFDFSPYILVDAQKLVETIGNRLSTKTQEVINKSSPDLKAALVLGSPEFMKY